MHKAAKLARNGNSNRNDFGSELTSVTDEDSRSMISLQSEMVMQSSVISLPSMSNLGKKPQDIAESSQKPRRSKLQLWNDLKISAITRSFTLIYTLALLTLLTRIQLNLLGRRSYLSSVILLATSGNDNQTTINSDNQNYDSPDQIYGNDFETNRKYLTFSWWLLHRGWRELMLKVEAVVKEVFGVLSPRDELTIEKFLELTLKVRKKIESSTEAEREQSKWLDFLLPPRDQEEIILEETGITPSLRRLLDETSDLIDTAPFTHILTLLLDAGFSTLIDQKVSQEAFKIPSESQVSKFPAPEVSKYNPAKLPLILAVLSRQAHIIGAGVSTTNEYLQAMEKVSDLEAFAAVVYSSNWENEIYPDSSEKNRDENEEISHDDMVIIPMETQKQITLDTGTATKFEDAWDKAVESVEISTK